MEASKIKYRETLKKQMTELLILPYDKRIHKKMEIKIKKKGRSLLMILVDKLNKEKKIKENGRMMDIYNDKVIKMIEIIEITERIESTQI